MTSRRGLGVLALAGVAAVAWTVSAPAQQQTRPFVPVTDEMLWKPNPADWLMWRRTLDSSGYSPLNQITRNNVAQLKMTWTRGMGAGSVQEATPLVYNGVMYLPNPNDYVQALDAKSGELLWDYRRKLPEDLRKFMPVADINRNLAIYGDTVIDTSGDDFVFALDVRTGAMRWETKILDYQKGAQQTSGPIIANGKVISGRGCEPEGGADACVITAHDAKTGKELWRTRTIPRPGEPGADTWGNVPEDKRIHVGTWMVPSYDPQLNLIYIGTSVSSPAPKYMLDGNDKKYLYHNSTLALNADSGRIEWYYQHLVDHWDLDHPFERLLIDTAVAPDAKAVSWINPRIKPGEKRQVLTGIPGKTGIDDTLDRRTGEFQGARPTVHQHVVARIDGATGAVTENTDTMFTAEGQTRQVCPGMNGGKNWPAGAYSPVTGLMYYPLQNLCMEARSLPPDSSLYAISAKGMLAPGTTNAGTVEAISVETGSTAWKYQQRAGVLSLVATGGGLVFGGDTAGRFRAFDDRTGKVLWEVNLGSPVSGYPVTFAVDGKQYVAVSTGPSLVAGGVNFTTPEIKPSATNQMYVFALP
jgi:alcohol dehydrogenase (cytochrome c)